MTVQDDLKRLDELAYGRREACEGLVRRWQKIVKPLRHHEDFRLLQDCYEWLFIPISLCPINAAALFDRVLGEIEAGSPVTFEERLCLNLLAEAAPDLAHPDLIAHEHAVTQANYEPFLRAQFKYHEKEAALVEDIRFSEDWRDIKKLYPVKKYRDGKHIIRRSLFMERGMKTTWDINWKSKQQRFQMVFDTFCQKWNLYGMQEDRPMLLKLSVNVTPQGTMIFLPAFWSIDPKRDLNWQTISRLHRARGISRQGSKLSQNNRELRDQALRACQLETKGKAQGLRGSKLMSFVRKGIRLLDSTDERQIRRIIQRGKAIAAG